MVYPISTLKNIKNLPQEENNIMGTSRIKQVGIYVGKHLRLFKNERGWKMIIFAAIIALLVSSVLGSGMFVYDMDTFSGTFALVSACIWIGIFNSIQSICKERAIIKREHRTGLHISSYVISHMIYQALLCLVEALIILIISALFLNYPTNNALLGNIYVEYFITYFLLTYGADVLGLAISSIVKTPATAMTVMPFILIIQLIFSGMLFTLSGPFGRIADLTLSKWGINATCISADYNNLESVQRLQVERYVKRAAEKNNLTLTDEMLDAIVDEAYGESNGNSKYNYELNNLATQWGILMIHIVAYGIISIIALEFVDKDKR